MSRLSDFVNASLLAIHHVRQSKPSPMIPAAAHAVLAAGPLSYLSALASSSFCRSLPAISHLSSAGHQLLRSLHGFVPSGFTEHWLYQGVWVLLMHTSTHAGIGVLARMRAY